jgi:hypothetical protein
LVLFWGTLAYTGAGFFKVRGNFVLLRNFSHRSCRRSALQVANQSIPAFTTTGTVSMLKTAGTATFTGNVNGGGLTINGTGGTLNLVSGTHTFLAHGQEQQGQLIAVLVC